MRHTITFDMDGVIAGGGYAPVWSRDQALYRDAPIVDEELVPKVLNALSWRHDVYIVSSRSVTNATKITREWLGRHGVEMLNIAGVITGINWSHKPTVITELGARFHVDDDPSVIEAIGPRGLLFDNPDWPENQSAPIVPVVDNWKELEQFFIEERLL